VDQLLELFAMERYAGDMFQSYSTGMRQKLNVARALLHDPPIVFLDEPTKGMDVQTADTVRALLREEIVNRQGKTVFLTTHDLYKMEQLCDRIGVLAQGQIQALGKPRELLHQMPRESRYTIELDQPVAGLDSKLAQLEGIRQIQMQGVQIEFAADEAAFSERAVWETIYNAGGRIQRFGPQDEGLRTFLRRVGDDHANSHNAG
jgi:ABC-2 type transport system ATP-binding protein